VWPKTDVRPTRKRCAHDASDATREERELSDYLASVRDRFVPDDIVVIFGWTPWDPRSRCAGSGPWRSNCAKDILALLHLRSERSQTECLLDRPLLQATPPVPSNRH
jgi:hypothetical protein